MLVVFVLGFFWPALASGASIAAKTSGPQKIPGFFSTFIRMKKEGKLWLEVDKLQPEILLLATSVSAGLGSYDISWH